MIFLGLVTGVVAYYWLWPKYAAARLVRKIEAYNRLTNERKQTE